MDHKHSFINYKIQEYIESHSLRLNEFQNRLIGINYRNSKYTEEIDKFLAK